MLMWVPRWLTYLYATILDHVRTVQRLASLAHPLRSRRPAAPISALIILAEAGDLRRFGHNRQFLKFFGLDLATCQSGMFRDRTKLSKYGNARLRRAFWMAA